MDGAMHQPIEPSALEQVVREQARQIGQLGIAIRALTQAIELLTHECERLKHRMMLLECDEALDEMGERRTVN